MTRPPAQKLAELNELDAEEQQVIGLAKDICETVASIHDRKPYTYQQWMGVARSILKKKHGLQAQLTAMRGYFVGIKNCVDKGSAVDMLCDKALTSTAKEG